MNKLLGVIKKIHDTRLDRNTSNIDSRIMKLCEESGEAIGALLSVRSNSYKGLTYTDLREEVIDTWIVATDAMLTPIGNETDDEVIENIISVMESKINKWRRNAKER